MKKIYLFVIVCCCACSHTKIESENKTASADTIPNWKTFHSHDYTIQYPDEWQTTTKENFKGGLTVFTSADTASITFNEEDLNLKEDRKKYIDNVMNSNNTSDSTFHLLLNRKMKNQYGEYQENVFVSREPLKCLEYIQVADNNLYWFTLATNRNRFKSDSINAVKIWGSFKLKK